MIWKLAITKDVAQGQEHAWNQSISSVAQKVLLIILLGVVLLWHEPLKFKNVEILRKCED